MPRVLLTRPSRRTDTSDEIHRALRDAGVEISELPMLNFYLPRDTASLDSVLVSISRGEFDYVVLSSPTAVEFFHERVLELGLELPMKSSGRFGAVGPATADPLRALGYDVTLPIPINAGAHELGALLSSKNFAGKTVLLLQSQIGLEHLEHALTGLGANVTRETLYLTKGPSLADAARLVTMLEGEMAPDVIAFFSPSSVSFFIRTLAEMSSGLLRKLPALAAIGETTAKAIEEALRRRPEIVARKSDQQSLASDILSYLQLKRSN